MDKICKIVGCGKKYYSKGFCRNHYTSYLRCGNALGTMHRCKIQGCNNNIFRKSIYCKYHKERIKRKLPLDLSIDCRITRMKGKNNPNWNGGTSYYINHSEMKRQKIIKLQQTKGKCEICGKNGFEMHHIDGSRDNHVQENLILLCRNCHRIIHSNRKNKTSKFIRLYGMNLKEMAEKFGGSESIYSIMYKEGRLDDFMKNSLTKQKESCKLKK